MSQEGMIIYFIAMGILILVMGIGVFANIPKRIRRYYQNDPAKAYIDIVSGSEYNYVQGRRINSKNGEQFIYRFRGFEGEVWIGDNYPARWKDGARYIKARPGQLIALWIPSEEEEYNKEHKPLEPQYTAATMGLTTAGYAIERTILSLKNQAMTGMIIWIIVGIVAIAGIGGLAYWQTHKTVETQGKANTGQTTTIPSQNTLPSQSNVSSGNQGFQPVSTPKAVK